MKNYIGNTTNVTYPSYSNVTQNISQPLTKSWCRSSNVRRDDCNFKYDELIIFYIPVLSAEYNVWNKTCYQDNITDAQLRS